MVPDIEILGLSTAVWDVVSVIANIVLTLGLLWFAHRQWAVTARQAHLQLEAERARLAERRVDIEAHLAAENRSLDRDFQLGWAEQFRLEGAADYYDRSDLVELASLGVLRQEDVQPAHSTDVFKAIARLGIEAGVLAGVAQSAAHETAQSIALLNAVVDSYRRQYPAKSPQELAAMVRHNRGQEVKALEARIRQYTRDLSLLYSDAINHSSRARVDRTMDFADAMQSPMATAAVKALSKRGTILPRSTPNG